MSTCEGGAVSQIIRPNSTRYPGEVAILFAHFPLAYHRFALSAAKAAECADALGRFEEMHNLLFRKQDSLGLKPWSSYAAESRISRTEAFLSCSAAKDPVKRIERDTLLARKLRIRGTPTILVNGWLWKSPPSVEQLDSIVLATRTRAQ